MINNNYYVKSSLSFTIKFIYEDTNFLKSTQLASDDKHKSSINELDNLLNDLDFAKKNFNQINNNNNSNKTRRSLEKLIDSFDGELVINRLVINHFGI
jgi:hypothetical protein